MAAGSAEDGEEALGTNGPNYSGRKVAEEVTGNRRKMRF